MGVPEVAGCSGGCRAWGRGGGSAGACEPGSVIWFGSPPLRFTPASVTPARRSQAGAPRRRRSSTDRVQPAVCPRWPERLQRGRRDALWGALGPEHRVHECVCATSHACHAPTGCHISAPWRMPVCPRSPRGECRPPGCPVHKEPEYGASCTAAARRCRAHLLPGRRETRDDVPGHRVAPSCGGLLANRVSGPQRLHRPSPSRHLSLADPLWGRKESTCGPTGGPPGGSCREGPGRRHRHSAGRPRSSRGADE